MLYSLDLNLSLSLSFFLTFFLSLSLSHSFSLFLSRFLSLVRTLFPLRFTSACMHKTVVECILLLSTSYLQAVLDTIDAYLEEAESAVVNDVTESGHARDSDARAAAEVETTPIPFVDISKSEQHKPPSEFVEKSGEFGKDAPSPLSSTTAARLDTAAVQKNLEWHTDDESVRRADAARNVEIARRLVAADTASRDLLCVLNSLSRRSHAARCRVDKLYTPIASASGDGDGDTVRGNRFPHLMQKEMNRDGKDETSDDVATIATSAEVGLSIATPRAPSPEERSGALRLVLEFLDSGGDLVYGDGVYTRTPVLMKAFTDYCRRRKLQGFVPPEETMQAAFRQRGLRQIKVNLSATSPVLPRG